MINPAQRQQLAQDLRQLVAGTITNYDFDDAYSDCYADSEDEGVREISEAAYCLYSDTRRYKLRGRDAVDRKARRIAARSVLFLRTNLPFEWPEQPSMAVARVLFAIASFGVPASIAILLCTALPLISGVEDIEFTIPLAAFGACWLPWSIWYLRLGYRSHLRLQAWRDWEKSGDYNVWPFFRRDDYNAARRTRHLLRAATALNDLDS